MDAKAYEFGDFRLDPADCILRCSGEPVPLTPKAFDLLPLLIEVDLATGQRETITD
jgi:DNA-binding response OmpR family regulator